MRFIPSFLSRSKYCFAVVLILASFVLPLFLVVGRAEALPPANIDEKVTQWLYYRGIWSCIGNFGEESNDDYTLSQDDVLDGQWFHDDKKGFGYIGPSLDDADITKGDDNDGTVSCKDGSAIDRATEDYFGFTNEVEFLCAIDDAMDDLGAKDAIQPAIGDADCEESGSWDIKSSKDEGDGNWRSALTDVLTESLADQGGRPRFHLGDNPDSEAWYYWIGRRGLEIFCGNGKPISEGVESNAGSSNDIVDVTYVDTSTGEVTSGINYFLANKDREQGSEVHDAYYGKGTGENASDRTCLELAALTNDNADDFEDYVKQHPDEGPTIDDSTPGGDIGTSSNSPLDLGCGGSASGFLTLNPLNFAENAINWIACPLVLGFIGFVHALENQIVSMLCVNESEIFGSATTSCSDTAGNADATSAGYKAAWNVFRIIALALLAITGLVMVVAQTAGLEIFDAYTIRKTLPRLLIAAIGISLSWPLLQFFVAFTNDLGIGVRALIYAPFNSPGIAEPSILSGGAGAITSIFAIGYLVSLGIFGTLLLAASAALAVILAFGVLIIRNILIVMLIIFAPIAIVLYILPNTQGVWKLWWSFFSKALLMFPIITAFIAIGHVFSAVALSGNPSTLQSLIGFAAYFAPYFLIPATFRFAGGAISTIGGFVNDRSRGAFDGLRNRRKAIQADRFKRAQSESLWDKNSFGGVGKFGNKVASWATDPVSNTQYYGAKRGIPGLKKSGARVAGQIEHAQVEQSRKLFEELNNMGFNDKGFRALNAGLWSDSMRTKFAAEGVKGSPRSLSDLDKIAHVLSQSEDQTERTAGQAIEANRGRLATLYQDAEMTKASMSAAGALGLAAHGFMNRQDLPAAANELVKEGGEGFARAVGTQAQLMGVRSRPEIKAGYGLDFKDGKFVGGLDDKSGLRALEAIGTFNTGDLSGAKAGTFDMSEKGVGRELQFILTQGTSAEAKNLATQLATNPDLKNEWKLTEAGQENLKKAIAAQQYDSVKDELLQGIGPYSQAAADTKTAMRNLLIASSIDPQEAYRRGVDPDTLRGGGIVPPEQNEPPGGA